MNCSLVIIGLFVFWFVILVASFDYEPGEEEEGYECDYYDVRDADVE